MFRTSTRLSVGFLAGILSHLLLEDGLRVILYLAHLAPALPWSLTPVPPLGVPASLNAAFWDGLWGLAYALVERRLTASFGRGPGGLLFGISPLLVYWVVVLPLKGLGVGGGFPPAAVPFDIAFNTIFGIGTVVFFQVLLGLARRCTQREIRP